MTKHLRASLLGAVFVFSYGSAFAGEAPEFARMVADKSLPPLDQRLPASPLVLKPSEQTGQYGGVWRTALLGGNDNAWLNRTIAYERLVNWDPTFTNVVPNVAESYVISSDGRTTSFTLRKGMKWSDGKPYTTADIDFFWNKLVLDSRIKVPMSSWWRTGGELPKLEIKNEQEFSFTFSKPNPLFVKSLAHPDVWGPTNAPRHYLAQFHGDLNPDADKVAAQRGFTGWAALLNSMMDGTGPFRNAAWPVLWGWKLTDSYGSATTRLEARRNPYYFKVDPEGNQLPYIESVTYDIGANAEALLLRVLNGEIDMISRHINTTANKPVIFDNQNRGKYRLIDLESTGPGAGIVSVNQTHKDPAKRELFNKKDFRIALSLAINRQDIIDGVFAGVGEPQQAALIKSSPYYSERFAKQFTEYDPDEANRLLDSLGMAKRGPDGFRLMPNGDRLSIKVVVSVVRPDWLDIMQFVQKDWQAVGIDVAISTADRALIGETQLNNDHDASIWFAESAGGPEPIFAPYILIPDIPYQSTYGIGWAYWRAAQGGDKAVEPPAGVKRAIETYQEVVSTVDDKARDAKMHELTAMAADNFMAIGISTPPLDYGIVSQRLGNVLSKMPFTYTWPTPAPSNPQTWFFK